MHQHDNRARARDDNATDNHTELSSIPVTGIDHNHTRLTTLLKRLHRNPWVWLLAIILITWGVGYPHIAGGIACAVALFFINQIVDSRMSGDAE